MSTAEQTEKRDDLMTLTVDGVEVRRAPAPGLTVIQVCDDLGVEIPRFCYHPELTIPANCRMCLVEVEKAPKLMPACHTQVRDGMVINTQNERVKKARESVLEFILVNHPVDCPICDQAGECPLQDQYFEHDGREARVGSPVNKVKKAKRVEVGPRVTLDQERCILCTRCVRFMDEVAKAPQLGMFWRGDHAYIDTFPGQPLDSEYSLNTVAICPVGALTSTDFRFKKRAWNLRAAPTLCDGCDRGCNAWLDRDVEGKSFYRYRARENEAVNRSWMCDPGFLSYQRLNEGRLSAARAGRGLEARVSDGVEVADQIGALLSANKGKVALVVSATVSTEEALAAAAFGAQALGVKALYQSGRAPGASDAILQRADKNPNTLGLQLAAEAHGLSLLPFADFDGAGVEVLLFIGDELAAEAPQWLAKKQVVTFARGTQGLSAQSDWVLPLAAHAEADGSFVNFSGRVQRFWKVAEPRGAAATAWEWLGLIGEPLGWGRAEESAGEVFEALKGETGPLAQVVWAEIDASGVTLEGVGAADEQTGGRGEPDRGVSRWPR